MVRVRFMMKDNALISVGGDDKSIIIWATDFGDEYQGREKFFEGMHIDFDKTDIAVPMNPRIFRDQNGEAIQSNIQVNNLIKIKNSEFEMEDISEGIEAPIIRPWLNVVKPPSTFVKPDIGYDQPPEINVQLDHCYGYRVKDKRNNLHYLQSGELLYHAAALGIVHNQNTNIQRFFNLHKDECTAIALHPDGVIVASGELGARPSIFIWDSKTMEPLGVAKQGLMDGIDHLAFSPDGKYLAATCMDKKRKVCFFRTDDYKNFFLDEGGSEPFYGLCWSSPNTLVGVGNKKFSMWVIKDSEDKSMVGFAPGDFKGAEVRLVSCAAGPSGEVFCGTVTGELQLWIKGTCTQRFPKLHTGSLDAIKVMANRIFTGGRDCVVNILGTDLKLLSSFNLYSKVKTSFNGHIRAITIDSKVTKIALGLISGEIYEFNCETDFNNPAKQLKEVMKAHYSTSHIWVNQTNALAVQKNGNYFLTGSDDGTLRQYSLTKKTLLQSCNLNIDENGIMLSPDERTGDIRDCSKIRVIAIHPNDRVACIGCLDGTVRIFSIQNFKQKVAFRHRRKAITEIKYSPDGTMVAIGSAECWIDFYLTRNMSLIAKVKKHTNPITHIDWSKDSSYIHSNCKGYELLFFQANNATALPQGHIALRDEDWHTWNSVFGWPVTGIYNGDQDGDNIHAVDRSPTKIKDYRLLAVTSDRGKAYIYRYPCIKNTSRKIDAKGHSWTVSNLKFSPNTNYLITTGADDLTVMQWKITPSAQP